MSEKHEKTKDDGKRIKCAEHRNAISIFTTLMLVVTLALCHTQNTVQTFAANSTKAENAWYAILSEEDELTQYKKPVKQSCTWANIPETVKIGNKTYKVTSIADNAFKGCTKLRRINIGGNVTDIGNNAFYGCQKLVSITIHTDKLSKSSVGSSAFAKVNPQAMAVVPNRKLSAYKAVLKGRGMNGKKQKVKEEKVLTFGVDKPLPKPESAGFTIGDHSIQGSYVIEKHGIHDSSDYTKDEVIPFTSGIELHPDIYGAWNTRKAIAQTLICGPCGKRFSSEVMLALHTGMSPRSSCTGGNVLYDETERICTEHYFVPDTAPCKVVYRFVLSPGLSYKEDSLKVVNYETGEIKEDNYHTAISGQEITITIDDIKSPPFHIPFNEQEYLKSSYNYHLSGEADRAPINVVFGTVMNGNTVSDNAVTSSITYSYKGAEKTVDLGSATIHAAGLKIRNTDTGGDSLEGASFTLYQKRGVYKEGAAFGFLQWTKVAEGLKADEVIAGLGTGKADGEDYYRIVQDGFPEGFEETEEWKFKNLEFSIKINTKGETTVTAKDSDGKTLPVKDGVINITVVNKAK